MANHIIKQFKSQALTWDMDKARVHRRWMWALIASCVMLSVLVVSLGVAMSVGLATLKKPTTLLVHERDDGSVAYVSVAPNKWNAVMLDAQVKSDLFHYVQLRESYGYDGLIDRFDTVQAHSTEGVTLAYKILLEDDLMKRLGEAQKQTVTVNDIVILSRSANQSADGNVAHIHFTTHDRVRKSRRQTAVVSWSYRKIPEQNALKYHNPFGFTVTRYDVTPLGLTDERKEES